MTTKHTPGPWRAEIDESGCWVSARAARGMLYTICDCDVARNGGFLAPAEMDANARLIAAAPRMYDYIAAKAAGGDAEASAIVEAVHAGR